MKASRIADGLQDIVLETSKHATSADFHAVAAHSSETYPDAAARASCHEIDRQNDENPSMEIVTPCSELGSNRPTNSPTRTRTLSFKR